MNTVEKLDYIRATLPETELLAQLAEEASELAQAALKLRRVLDGRNYTPVTEEEARRALFDETNDVVLCLITLDAIGVEDVQPDEYIMKKLNRWVARLKENSARTDE